jgi:hypothetical protein
MLSEKLHVTAEVKKCLAIGEKFCSFLFQTIENICQVPNDLSPFAFVQKTQTSSFKAKVILAFVQKSTDFKLLSLSYFCICAKNKDFKPKVIFAFVQKTQTSSFKANAIIANHATAEYKNMKKFKKVYFDLLPKRSKDDPASEDYSALAEYWHVAQALQLQHTMLLKIRLT